MIISQTPLRLSFLGGGTDFKGYYSNENGIVLSTAIDKYIYVIINERYDNLIYINYSQKEITDKTENIKHELVREALLKTGIKGGIEITMLADIPSEGSGLGSSSSLTVGLLNALYTYTGKQVTQYQLAADACDIEITKCQKPIGKQDQYIASFGGFKSIKFMKINNVKVEDMGLSNSEKRFFSDNLLLFYTGITRKSEDILTKQSSNININIDYLTGIKKLCLKGIKELKRKNYKIIGNYLDSSWRLKKHLADNISNEYIDEMYNSALDAGAIGGKIAGAGGGGFLLIYCEPQHHVKVRKALSIYRELPFSFENDGTKIIFNYRRNSWK